MKKISHQIEPATTLLDIAMLALLEVGPYGLRQERLYPPKGIQLQTTGQTYTDGNLRNQASVLKTEYGIVLARHTDPYFSMDGRRTDYKRYRIVSTEQAGQIIKIFNLRRQAKGQSLLPDQVVTALLSAFEARNSADFSDNKGNI